MTGFEEVFARLRQLMLDSAPDQVVANDAPGDLVLHTHQKDPKTGKPVWFGAVAIKKSYVAFHLFPLYTHPALARDLPDLLARRMQGKSCFNFKSIDEPAFADLADLTRAARNLVNKPPPSA